MFHTDERQGQIQDQLEEIEVAIDRLKPLLTDEEKKASPWNGKSAWNRLLDAYWNLKDAIDDD